MPRVAVVAGSTGLIGRECVQRLKATYPRLICLVRRPTGRPEDLVIDFDRMHEVEIPAGADVFCALGTTIKKAGSQEAFRKVDLDYPYALAKRSVECGARQFLIVSSVGADTPGANFYLQVKREMEQLISALSFDAVHIFRPSVLTGDREESRPAERAGIVVASAIGFLLVGSLSKYRAISGAVVAQAMVNAAQRGEPGVHIYHYNEMV